ncbi:MAG: CPBP family intramembrane metalloprotease [Treponema sp.]|jgi:membrane protease YdiL (CAAX protease family)|nr:CPBP family intramembrane metalloprotease [Treponema sp.]
MATTFPGPQVPEDGSQKNPEKGLALFIEPLILYCILFLPGALRSDPPSELVVFSAYRELIRTLVYNLPALALIWYLWRKSGRGGAVFLPGLQDLFGFLLAFPSLVLTGICVSRAAAFFPELPANIRIEAPGDITGFAALFFSCISTGYLEEGYFRYYLGEKIGQFGLGPRTFLLISTVLFSFCHVYEGPWGTMNSVLAAVILGLVYIRFRSLHGIALAHGFYNLVVYLMSGVQA